VIRRTLNTTPKVVISAENGYLFINTLRIPLSQANALLEKIHTVVAIYTGLNPENNYEH
jgi:hypothetical protein